MHASGRTSSLHGSRLREKYRTLSWLRSICFNAQDPCVAMSVEQAIHELQEQLQRVSAGHQAMNQELATLRSMVDTRSRIRLVEPKTLMPDRFCKNNGPSWRTWSYLARDFVGVAHSTLKQAMKNAENRKLPITVTNLQHDFGVTNEMDQELQHFLISRTEGEAMEVVRGAEREPGLEQWRRLAALYDPLMLGGVWTTAGKFCLHRKLPKLTTSRTPSKPGRIWNNDSENVLEINCLKTCDLQFSTPCVPQI